MQLGLLHGDYRTAWPAEQNYKLTAAATAKSVTIKGRMLYEVVVNEAYAELRDPANHLNEPLPFGPGQATITQLQPQANGWATLHLSLKMPPGSFVEDNSASFVPLHADFFDADGTWTGGSALSGAEQDIAVRPKTLDKLILLGAVRRTKAELNFELKDVPVPDPLEVTGMPFLIRG